MLARIEELNISLASLRSENEKLITKAKDFDVCKVTISDLRDKNDYSRFTWVFFLQEKSQTQETLKRFLRRAQNEFGLRIKKIRSDNGTEFKNSQIEGFLEEEGIKHEFSSPYTPQQNVVVDRKNRTLLDMARTMLDEYKTPDRFWAETINTACYSIDQLYLH